MIANTMRVHILVDLAGHTGGHRMGVLARRPAPVSVTFLGFAATTGADFIDYIVSDALVSPPELACAFSETLGMIPPTMYPVNTEQAIAAPMPTRRQLGLPAEASRAFVLACFNRNLKIKPDVWAVCEAFAVTPAQRPLAEAVSHSSAREPRPASGRRQRVDLAPNFRGTDPRSSDAPVSPRAG